MATVRRPWDEGPDLIKSHSEVRKKIAGMKDPFAAPANPIPHANARTENAKGWKGDDAMKLEFTDEIKPYHGEALHQSDQVLNGRIKRG